jgi:serine/threonine-protein kinase
VRPTFDELIQKLGDISRRLGGRVPPRHQNVELIRGSSAAEERTEPPPAGGGNGGGGGTRTVAIAVTAGIAIGVGVSLVAIFVLQ